jgi:hypothetical protein
MNLGMGIFGLRCLDLSPFSESATWNSKLFNIITGLGERQNEMKTPLPGKKKGALFK